MQFWGEEIFYLSTKKNLLSAFYYFYFYGKFLFCLFGCKEKSIVAKTTRCKTQKVYAKKKNRIYNSFSLQPIGDNSNMLNLPIRRLLLLSLRIPVSFHLTCYYYQFWL